MDLLTCQVHTRFGLNIQFAPAFVGITADLCEWHHEYDGRISAPHIPADLGLIYLLQLAVTLSVHLSDLAGRASMAEQLIEAERSVFVGQSAVTKYI